MYDPNVDILTKDDFEAAREGIDSSPHCVKTPLLCSVQKIFPVDQSIDLYLKCENMQTTGSFKVRGVTNQFKKIPSGYGTDEKKLVSISAGNYGKAFAFMCKELHKKGLIIMPVTAPDNREKIIRSYGVDVLRAPSSELFALVDQQVKDKGMLFLHSYDDVSIMAGYGSVGFEILEEVSNPDIVIVCCGGGGLVSGIAGGIKTSGHKNCRIYGVEPEGSRTMFESFKEGKAVSMNVKSVASGLSPPSAGQNAFKHCKEFVEDILLVTDEEILQAVFELYSKGLVVEPSGAAAFAALMSGKVKDVKGKKVVVVLTGGNVSPEELVQYKNI